MPARAWLEHHRVEGNCCVRACHSEIRDHRDWAVLALARADLQLRASCLCATLVMACKLRRCYGAAVELLRHTSWWAQA